MTRQSRARLLAFATALLVVLLAALFAWLRNLPPSVDSSGALPSAGASASGGRDAFRQAGCTTCHSAEGQGNPNLPLDGVGARLDRESLREAAFGTAARLPPGIAEIKRARASAADAEPLLDYLQRLR